MTGPERTLLLRVFGYFEPGTATAATDRMGEPFGLGCGARPAFGPCLPHRFRTGGGWTFLIFGLFGGSSHPPIKNPENIAAQDYGVQALPTGRRQRRATSLGPGPASWSAAFSFANSRPSLPVSPTPATTGPTAVPVVPVPCRGNQSTQCRSLIPWRAEGRDRHPPTTTG